MKLIVGVIVFWTLYWLACKYYNFVCAILPLVVMGAAWIGICHFFDKIWDY